MPLLPSFIERLLFIRLNKGPGPIFDWVGALGFKSVVVALRLGVFDALGREKLTGAELARKLEVDRDHLVLLLDALQTFGYLKKRWGRYSNTPSTLTWLLSSSSDCIADVFHQADDMMRRWDQLDETIRNGTPPALGPDLLTQDPGGWDRYHRGLRATARLVSREVVAKAEIPKGSSRLLDVGGSHGFFSVELCKRYPNLRATVFDWPQAQSIADETIAEAGMEDRVRFLSGDFMKDDPGSDYDVVLLFNVIRIFPPDQLGELLSLVKGWLRSGGTIVVMDHLNDKLFSRFLTANARMIELELINSTAGKIHRGYDVVRHLRQAGFEDLTEITLIRSPGLGLVIGKAT